ncbi:CGNR zinc finger domain-containing protein [Gracilibacillus suaedae]|uniref:CGNR zinc finger domain-containing protein n=1 Tax=Gracilibacillus suaedae TaxID=2820273 RepID=UPI001ABE0D49|nr:CGNR zinc finger domain-containing protein [Gracilibacillus suaedae]
MANEVTFPLISGNISIDLINTEVVRHGIRHDLLTKPEHVIAWFHTLTKENIIMNQQFNMDIEDWAEDSLPRLREMRSLLRKSYENVADGVELSSDWITDLELFIKQAPFAYQLIDGKLVLIPVGEPAKALVSLIALDALSLIDSGQLSYLHRCANPECVLLFIDTRGRRKWCSMKICGNRHKVTRHQHKKKEK